MYGTTLRWIDWDALHAAGFRAIVFDKDNTLTIPYERRIHPPLASALRECKRAFGAANVAVLSNSAGLTKARSDSHWSPYDRVRVVDADP